MKCRVCNKADAVVHVTQVSGPVLLRGDYCLECAAVLGFNKPDVEVDLAKIVGTIEAETKHTWNPMPHD